MPIIYVVVITLLITLGFSYFIYAKFNSISQKQVTTLTKKENDCTYNGETSKDQFLDDYKVQPGDSVLLIAKRQLGNSSRVNELALLNLTRYPGFYKAPGIANLNPFLEVGWVLKVPSKRMPVTSGNLAVLSGQVINGIVGYDFGISRTSDEFGRYSYFNLDKDTINENKTVIKIGDCVTLLRDNVTMKTIKIDLQ